MVMVAEIGGNRADRLLIHQNRRIARPRPNMSSRYLAGSLRSDYFVDANVSAGPRYEGCKPPKSMTIFSKTTPGSTM